MSSIGEAPPASVTLRKSNYNTNNGITYLQIVSSAQKHTYNIYIYIYLQTAKDLETRGHLESRILEQKQLAEVKLMGFHEHAILKPGEVSLWRR